MAQIVFVRKRMVEIQYLRTTITEARRQEFGALVEETIRQHPIRSILRAQRHSFSAEPVQHLFLRGFCLGRQDLADAALVRRPGAEDLGWLDELNY